MPASVNMFFFSPGKPKRKNRRLPSVLHYYQNTLLWISSHSSPTTLILQQTKGKLDISCQKSRIKEFAFHNKLLLLSSNSHLFSSLTIFQTSHSSLFSLSLSLQELKNPTFAEKQSNLPNPNYTENAIVWFKALLSFHGKSKEHEDLHLHHKPTITILSLTSSHSTHHPPLLPQDEPFKAPQALFQAPINSLNLLPFSPIFLHFLRNFHSHPHPLFPRLHSMFNAISQVVILSFILGLTFFHGFIQQWRWSAKIVNQRHGAISSSWGCWECFRGWERVLAAAQWRGLRALLGFQPRISKTICQDFQGEKEVLGGGGIGGFEPAEKSDCWCCCSCKNSWGCIGCTNLAG